MPNETQCPSLYLARGSDLVLEMYHNYRCNDEQYNVLNFADEFNTW
jgi:hypothetical protein